MAINLKKTADVSAGSVKLLVYGQAGAGKTHLIRTLPRPFIVSAESGLLSLRDADLPYVEIANMDDLTEIYDWLAQSHEAKSYESVAVDSLSEIAEVVLNFEKKNTKDPRAAYGEMQTQMTNIIRSFRDLNNKHIYMSAKLEKSQDEMGKMNYSPSIPGNKMGQMLPYFFDEVLALRIEKDDAGMMHRALLCDSDGLWQAKDRSGNLESWEIPDLGIVINKIINGDKK